MLNLSMWCWRLVWVLCLAAAMSGCRQRTPTATGSDLVDSGSSNIESSQPGTSESDLAARDREQAERTRGYVERGPESGGTGPLQDIQFDYDSFDLSQEARDILQSNANWLRSNEQTKIEIEGHCDERGTVEYNLALGAKRAKSVRDYLVTLEVSASRISTISYGEELPLCREATESCWQQNRRAHFLVVTR